MEAVRFAETLLNVYQNTRRHIQQSCTLQRKLGLHVTVYFC
jgi:hypothetical protein